MRVINYVLANISRLKLAHCFLVILCLSVHCVSADSEWQELFDGKSFANWKQLGGAAEYTIEHGEVVGTSKADTPNSFLTTAQLYGDFILEFEVKVDTGLNSGVQIRSNSRSDYLNGRVHGYQVEIDTSPRAFSGGIYDESRRGWLYPLTRNDAARSAFRNGEWNLYRVEAIGNRISTWVNGQQTARLIDDLEPQGFIALQVHSIETPEQTNRQIRWRNIRIKTKSFIESQTQDNPAVEEISFLNNLLTETEKRKGWRLLWDGKTTKGWRSTSSEKFPVNGWELKNGVLAAVPSGEAAITGNDLISEQQFHNFELQLEFKLSKGTDSGIQYFVGADLSQQVTSGLEFQLLDDKNHPDVKSGVNGNHSLGSLYDLIAAENLSIPGRNKQFKGVEEWNHARIIVRNGQVEHWLNNEKVIDFDRNSQLFKALIAQGKNYVSLLALPSAGHILLQNKGDSVQFRNIKIRE